MMLLTACCITQTIIDEFIMAAEFRIYQELPMDSQTDLFKKVL